MSSTVADPAEHDRRRWTRENAHLYIRHDAGRFMRPDVHRFMRPDAARFLSPGAADWRHPDEGLWNFHAVHERRTTCASAMAGNATRAAELVRLRAERDSIRCAVLQLQQERRRKRDLEQAEAERLKRTSAAAWEKFIAAFNRHWRVYYKAGFDPQQPCDDQGRWTDAGGSGRPDIPKERPPTAQLRNRVVKEVAKWLAKATVKELAGPAGTLLNIIEVGSWLYEAYPHIRSYLDEPKTLDELQRAAQTREAGYNVHHVVEQTPAEQDGFPRSLIDGPGNLVRIPTLKHWEITGWYMMPNKDYDGVSPRAYLRGKSWDERTRVGIDALVKYRVLKP